MKRKNKQTKNPCSKKGDSLRKNGEERKGSTRLIKQSVREESEQPVLENSSFLCGTGGACEEWRPTVGNVRERGGGLETWLLAVRDGTGVET